jgi:predicted TIM-barrel fold metal-dependent hydrolase
VSGVVVVEASAWLEDNQWILDLAAREPVILGFVGHIDAANDAFPKNIARFAANPLFRGIRLGGGAVKDALRDPAILRRLQTLADADLSLDVVGGPEMLADVARLAKAVPGLRVLIDHVAGVRVDGKAPDTSWKNAVLAAGENPNVYCKASGLVEGTGRADGSAPTDPDYYKPTLDAVWQAFGPDRLVYGSNWPVSELFATFATTQSVAMAYFRSKGEEAFAKCFHSNSKAFYKWRDRPSGVRG